MVKKDKIFELKIEEDDEISGISSISLVDEPAIEVMWVAFNKTSEDFHIPDGEDEKYLKELIKDGESEKELLAQGWEIDRIENISKEDFFTSDPNAPSSLDDKNFLTRFKYAKNPDASGPVVKDNTRQFCRELIAADLVFRKEDISGKIYNQFGSPALRWRGGYNCRHLWQRIVYKRTADIGNASSTKGRINIGPSYTVPGNKPQPNTTPKTQMSKEDLAVKSYSDYPDSVRNNAQAVLNYVQRHGWGSCGTEVGKQRANQLAKGQPISLETVQRMYSYLSRHAKDLDTSRSYDDGCGKLMYDAWGGKSALSWAESKLNDFGYDVSTITGYVDPDIKKKKKKSYADEFEYPFSKEDKKMQHFATDSEKRIVLGPAMIPNMKIFRRDMDGNPYYVFFSSETIKMIASKYMKNKYTDNNDEMHNGEAVEDVYVVESWIKESDNDKSTDYGYKNLPVGTWFVSMKVNNDEIWNKIKSQELNGFSVSGYFEEVAAFKREEVFLSKVAEILKNIQD